MGMPKSAEGKGGSPSNQSEQLPDRLEEAIKELEELVQKLESPELPLEDSIALFERGTKLSDVCYAKLQEAEKKVELLLKKVPQPSKREDFQSKSFEES
jgi:exodeoxyribonuclease VII small subunit